MPRTYRHGRPTIGVLAGWQFAWTATPLSYLEPVYRGICMAAQELDCNVLLGCGMGSWTGNAQSPTLGSESPRPAWPLLSPDSDFVPIGPENTDGIIAVNPLHSEARSRYLQELRAAGHPLIFIAAGERGPTVAADNRGGILQAMRHLVAHGHQRIAFIAGSPDDMQGDSGERLRVYQDAVKMNRLLVDPRLMAWGRHVYDGGYRAMQEILDSGAAFTAVLASNDESALGAMQAIHEAGYVVPQDIAIVGFDDRPESAVPDLWGAVQAPPLSSVHVPLRQMGYRAVESLYRYITGQAEMIEPVRVATRLAVRESCGCGQSPVRPAAPPATAPRTGVPDPITDRGQLVETMAASILVEVQGLSSDEVEALCRSLVAAFDTSVERDDPSRFQETLEALLHQGAAGGDDVHVWQAAISSLEDSIDQLPLAHRSLAHELLQQAHIAISATVQRQFRRHVVDQRWTLNRLGALTARLLAALDETQIYRVLAQHLPAMGVETAWLALFDAEAESPTLGANSPPPPGEGPGERGAESPTLGGEDPVAWTTLRDITSLDQGRARHTVRFPSLEFPPTGLLPPEESAHPPDQAFCLALFPLSGPRGQLGYVAFDTARLDLYGAITQELATALSSAQAHREATEGRRLAEEANEIKSRFLSTVSHELRTPLNLIVGLSGILLQESDEGDSPLPEPHRKDVEQIYANAQHLGGLIGDVLDLASSDAGRLRLANEFVDLSEALRPVAETGRALAYNKGLSWHSELLESGPWVWGDRTRLRQIVLNLVNNAIKYTTQGQVRLELESGPDAVTIAVHDTGLGIPVEEQSAIFDEFRRSERSIGRGYEGLGLGLTICRRLVELHGGTIGVRSSGEEGTGSTFFVTLPPVQPTDQVQRLGISSLTAESILVLSQRAGSGPRLHDYLAGRGFDVQTALIADSPTLGNETPDWLSQLVVSPPGAVVVDMSAAPHQGWSVLRAIKSHPRTQSLPVLFCSLSPDAESPTLGSGSVLEFDYLTKPIELTDLTRALDQHWLIPEAGQGANAILVVDDDPETLEMHTRIVQAYSPAHQVLAARNGLEALDILQREKVDLLLLDLVMPELDGFDVLEAMREKEATRQVPVIVLTGQVLTEREMARLSRGVQTVLSKGLFTTEETLAHVETALERNRRLSSAAQRLVRQAMAYIHTHYAEPISRTALAHHVALSEDYLTSSFRAELGVTPIAYVNRYRVNQAKRLLIETEKSITEISLDVGFSDSGYFSRVFRREVGVSPEAFRQA
jgi:signal transduction histidine kinase/AraC-like DNA-binding protein